MEIFDELEGSAIALPLGKDIRFSVFDSDMGNGSSWKLKTHSDTQDVYLYMRDGADWVHTSSHEGGRSHFATTSSPELDDDDKKESYYVDVTFGAQEVHPGWNLIFQIIVPDSSLQTDYVEKVKATKFMKIPVAKNGIQNATLIQIYKVTTALNYLTDEGKENAKRISATSPYSVVLAWKYVVIRENPHITFAQDITKAREELLKNFPDTNSGRIVMLIKDILLPNTKTQIELAVNLK